MKMVRVLPSDYRDSLYLMKLSSDISQWPAVRQAVIVMGTESNKRILGQVGLLFDQAQQASPGDLVIAVELAEEKPINNFWQQLEQRLRQPSQTSPMDSIFPNLESALKSHPEANLVSISISGEYAPPLIRSALTHGKHVFCFSHHIAIDEEIALKDFAIERGLLMMGPDCGTAVIDGCGLGFANRVQEGQIGIVSASGSGLQEIITQLDKLGAGTAQAIGVGGRDMSDPVNGRMAAAAIEHLKGLTQVKVLVILAKSVSKKAWQHIYQAIQGAGLPTIIHFQDHDPNFHIFDPIIQNSADLEDCARKAASIAKTCIETAANIENGLEDLSMALKPLTAERQTIRGLFAGGSLCAEAVHILKSHSFSLTTNLEEPVISNLSGHVFLDLGAEEYTEGRPHPYIDPRVRNLEIHKAFKDTSVAILLLDVVLGMGCHEDPAGEVVTALQEARQQYGHGPIVIASVCGTQNDPQNYNAQRQKLVSNGVIVSESNAAAAHLAAYLGKQIKSESINMLNKPGASREKLLGEKMMVINVGLPLFGESLQQQGAQVVSAAWCPPQKTSAEIENLLADLI